MNKELHIGNSPHEINKGAKNEWEKMKEDGNELWQEAKEEISKDKEKSREFFRNL